MIDSTKTVLIVEDDQNLRMNLEDILQFNGFNTLSAKNGYEGYKLALVKEPDIIISDIRMPQMDGLELLKKLQENSITSFIPFIFLSAKVELQDIRAGMALGADDYITKPFKIDDVLNTISSRLRKKNNQINIFEEFKNNIVKNVAHELRTPLVSIIGFSEIIEKTFDGLTKDDIIEIAKSINKSGKKLHHRIEKFMLYAELLSENKVSSIDVEISDTDPDELKDLVQKKASEYDREKDLSFSIQSGKVGINAKLINLILTELVENSLKFSVEGTPITISVECKGRYYILKVTDYGSGIKTSKIENINAFTLLNSNEKNTEGLGLGLTIIKKITNLYNGYMNIDSEENKFTIIEIGFPLSYDAKVKAS
ncbi:MAG: response regulator [bacterium]